MRIIVVDDKAADLELLSDLVYEVDDEFEILEFDDPLRALAFAREKEIDVAFIGTDMADLAGVELGRYLQELNSSVNLIFIGSDKKYAFEAIDMHASGYILKPATAEAVEKELKELRFPEFQKEHKRVFAQTFGNFELFVDGEPVEFKYKRTKEIIALLVNNRGAQTTNGQLIANMWEDDGEPDKKTSYLCNLRQDLQNTFNKLKLENIILKQRGSMAIAKDKIECDLYDYLEKKDKSKYTYAGEYMAQYSWSEYYTSELDEICHR